jgi:tetratricopeptide (TPR) repeat protein
VQRRIKTSVEWFRANREKLLSLDPDQKNAAALVGYLSQWVDMGYGEAAVVRELLRRFPQSTRVTLPVYDYIHLELAEGMVAAAEEEIEKAIARFDVVIALGEAIGDKELLSLAFFWKARCKRKQGEYDSALKFAEKGRELASALDYPRIAAVIQVLVSWLHFQKENLPEAIANLKNAEAVLMETDDSVTLGNIQSGYGRIALREARYEQALDHFERAIELYKQRDPRHRNLARSLTNIAYVKRLTATRLTLKVDAEADRRRKGNARNLTVPGTHALNRQRVAQLHEQVLASLTQAEDIYRSLKHHRGRGTVHLERSLLFLDSGDIDRAATEVAFAYQLASEKNDHILTARSCIVQSMIESVGYDEGLTEDFASHAQRALDFARQAVAHAQHTENRHLLARAYIWEGMVLSNDYFNDNEASRDCCDRAALYLTRGLHDRLWEEHQILRARVLRNGTIDVALRKWSQGETEDYSFQQLVDRFADLIIPKVWEREGRKVSRVAKKLSISPKKVRRVLSRLGLKGD